MRVLAICSLTFLVVGLVRCAEGAEQVEGDCGNGVVEPGEVCDDGNAVAGDGCGVTCEPEDGWDCAPVEPGATDPSQCTPRCGDGLALGDEICDGTDLRGATCASASLGVGELRCTGCELDPLHCGAYSCGNGVADPWEPCEGADVHGATCLSLGFDGGALACTGGCALDPSGCTMASCGDGVRSGAETCDDANTAAADGCTPNCQVEAGWVCGGTPSVCQRLCGNAFLDPGEECDGADLAGATCESLGYDGGTLACADTCAHDRSQCVLATCGNGQVEPGEQCDGIDLGGASCTSLGFIGGMLTCTAACGYGTQSCIPVVCGDGVPSAGEACDDGNTTSGDGCNAACSVEAGWICSGAPSACVHSCGNGTLEVGESCDGAALDGQTCAGLGFAGGTLACLADCTFDTSACAAAICGNGAIEPGESCDGANLGGHTCAEFGFPAGSLACASCSLDTGGCLACAAQGCQSDLAPNANTCGNARVVGRLPATGTAHLTGDTTSAGNNDDVSTGGATCYDAKYDQFYRIYLMAGDQINVTLDPLDSDFDAMMKLYSGTDCAANGTGDLIGCYQSAYDGSSESLAFTATADGWYTVVVDGRYAFADDYDYGDYTLDVTLTCATPGCCCP